MESEIVVVSGLPRSGTSLMMQMLEKGGIEIVTDKVREADDDNPHGYYEYESVKKLQQDAGWLAEIHGKAVKIISQLLFVLPDTEQYRVIFMDRNLEEVLASQETMIKRQGRKPGPADALRKAFTAHKQRLEEWLPLQSHITLMRVNYSDVINMPQETATKIKEFLKRELDSEAMVSAVDPTLYRNRTN